MRIPFTDINIAISRNETPRGQHTTGGTLNMSGILGGQGVRVAPQDLWSIYRLNADVYSCIRELKQGVGDAGYKLSDPRDEEMEPASSVMAYIDFIFSNSGGFRKIKNKIIRDVSICGNAYIEIVQGAGGKAYSLSRLDPRSMYVIADKHGQILRYVQRVHGGQDISFDPSQIWHIVFESDPDNELLGFSPLETALWEARTDISAAQSNYYFFENDAVPSVLYIAENGTSEDEQKAAVEAIKEQFGGAKNRNKSGMLSGIKEIKTLSISQKDMEFVVGRKFNTDKVCSVYGVPKFILGYTETVNYSNGANLLEKFYRGTIQPLETSFSEAVNSQLMPKIGLSGQAVFNFLPQSFNEQSAIISSALDELRSGAITLRQYKVKTGQEVTKEDEQETMLDKHIIHSGASAVMMEDVGVDPVVDPNDPVKAQNMINAIEKSLQKYEKDS